MRAKAESARQSLQDEVKLEYYIGKSTYAESGDNGLDCHLLIGRDAQTGKIRFFGIHSSSKSNQGVITSAAVGIANLFSPNLGAGAAAARDYVKAPRYWPMLELPKTAKEEEELLNAAQAVGKELRSNGGSVQQVQIGKQKFAIDVGRIVNESKTELAYDSGRWPRRYDEVSIGVNTAGFSVENRTATAYRDASGAVTSVKFKQRAGTSVGLNVVTETECTELSLLEKFEPAKKPAAQPIPEPAVEAQKTETEGAPAAAPAN